MSNQQQISATRLAAQYADIEQQRTDALRLANARAGEIAELREAQAALTARLAERDAEIATLKERLQEAEFQLEAAAADA